MQELSGGLSRITGLPASDLEAKLWNYLSKEDEAKALDLNDAKYEEIEKNTGVSKTVLDKLLNKYESLDANKPLVAYKKAVGGITIKKAVSSRLFEAIGLNISSDLFGPDEFYAIMNGDFKSLYGVAGAMIDQELNLPEGSTWNFLSAPNTNMRQCALSELGANMLGRSVGLDYVSLKGNIYENVGRSKIEQTLDIPRNSFRGTSVDELIDNIGPINFALAFHIPMDGITFPDGRNFDDGYLAGLFSPDYVKAIKNLSMEFKLQAIQDYAGANSNIPDEERDPLEGLNKGIKNKIKDILNPNQDWWNSDYTFPETEQGLLLKKMKMQISSLDSIFKLEQDRKTTKGLTELMLTEKKTDDITITTQMGCKSYGFVGASSNDCPKKEPIETVTVVKNIIITPNSYLKKVSNSTAKSFALSGLVDLLGADLTD
ncbi:MAG: hypothetical protein AAB906_03115, partial [Patescibacteria group bacterium]